VVHVLSSLVTILLLLRQYNWFHRLLFFYSPFGLGRVIQNRTFADKWNGFLQAGRSCFIQPTADKLQGESNQLQLGKIIHWTLFFLDHHPQLDAIL